MMLYACMFALGFATGVGVGAYQAVIFLFVKPEKKGIHDDRPT
jgi:hypothetical protein